MRVLVTGGAGFIGSYLLPILLEKGFEPIVFDLANNPASLAPFIDRITYFKGDLGSKDDLYRAMLTYRPKGIFHLGAVLAGPCEDNPIMGFKVNFESTLTLLDACVAVGAERFFMVSSISVFGRGVTEPVRDDAIKIPETVYGQTKLASEHMMLWYAKKHGLDTRALRFTWVFGPGRTTGITALYSSLILDAISTGTPIRVPNPDERGDWLYIRDAVGAILSLWEAKDPRQRIYNIAGGVHSIREVVEIARRLRPDAPVILESEGRSLSPYPVAYDDRAARAEIGWVPRYSIEEAVHEHLETAAQQRYLRSEK
ncbi:MAG: NAD(P)-dependent oxidoreductase [Deltaproteobacteria bacterium]|nr:NAD(P)-dependent oxidoreductase [Deltaproteobacteria bacterium]